MAKTPTPSAKKKKVTAPVVAKPKPAEPPAEPKQRRVKVPAYSSFRLQKKVKREVPGQHVPSAFRLLRSSLGVLKRNWKLFLGIAVVYGVLNMALVSGFSAANLSDAKQSFSQAVNGQINQLATGLSLFVYLLGTSGSTATPTASVYQIVLAIIVSLAVIWALREVYVGNKVRIRDPYYKGMFPLIPFVLVLVVIGIQLVPLAGGAMLYNLVVSNGIAATAVERAVWLLLFGLLALASIYMICSSLFALYIVSLPDVGPMAALRSAKQLVLHRRWMVLRKVLFLPLAIVVITGIILTPIIIVATPVAPWVFFGLSMLLLPIVHSYLYTLYRSLL